MFIGASTDHHRSMNITHEPAAQPEQPEQPQQPAEQTPPPEFMATPPEAETARFFQWLRHLGVQRGPNRWMGGVCSGLATKWGIDPVIVRGLAVVLTLFFGVGLLAYGVAWALLPEPDGRIHVEEVGRGHWTTGMTGASILSFLGLLGPGQGFLWGGRGDWTPWPLFWIAGVGGIIYWAMNRHKNKGEHPAQEPGKGQYPQQQFSGYEYLPQQYPAQAKTGAPQFQTGASDGPFIPQQPFMPTPPRQAKAVKTTPRLSAPAILLALGLAVIVGATVLILNAAGAFDLHGYQVATAAGAAAITAGVAIVIAGFKGRAAGGVGAFAIVSLVLAGLLSLPAHNGEMTALTNVTWAPSSVSAAQAGRTFAFGDATLDLTKLENAGSFTSEVVIPLDIAASQVVIKVPANIPVRINSDLAAASLSIDGKRTGESLAESASTDVNPDATGYGLIITLDGAASNISVITVPAQ